jgi:hypothetical protein
MPREWVPGARRRRGGRREDGCAAPFLRRARPLGAGVPQDWCKPVLRDRSEIAKRLFLSEKTVAHHVSAILRKLGVRTRTQASTRAVRLGLVAQTSVGTAPNLG